jgi:hypothetical protein
MSGRFCVRRTLTHVGPEPEPEQDRDLTDLEALERELAALERELEVVDGTPGDD